MSKRTPPEFDRAAHLRAAYEAREFLADLVSPGDAAVVTLPDGTSHRVIALETYKSGSVTFDLDHAEIGRS